MSNKLDVVMATALWQPITILALIATILMLSNQICIFTLIAATIYHLEITAHRKKGIQC